MTDDLPEDAGTQTFSSGDIARLMWRELDPAVSPEPLTFDRLNAALRTALLTHFADISRRSRESEGRKTN